MVKGVKVNNGRFRVGDKSKVRTAAGSFDGYIVAAGKSVKNVPNVRYTCTQYIHGYLHWEVPRKKWSPCSKEGN